MIKPEEDLINEIINDTRLSKLSHCSYVMATIKHETASTFLPIAEYGKGKGYKYGIPDPQTGKTYYGRGYVQLTWKDNYDKFSKLLKKDLVGNPDLALKPSDSYEIIVTGMIMGLFTGKKLDDYLNEKKTDYVNARRIINGTDRAFLISTYAKNYEQYFS